MTKIKHQLCICLFSMLPLSASAGTFQPFIDVLAWQASQSNTAWATVTSNQTGSRRIDTDTNSYNIRPGFMAGVSYLANDTLWDTTLSWTSYATDTTNNIPVSGAVVLPLFFSSDPFISGDVFFGATSHWQLAMNMFDLDIRKHYQPSSTFSLSPMIGMKGGSIMQDISVNWDAVLYHARENITTSFRGIGPTIGLGADWRFYGNFSLVGNVASTIMYGNWNMKDTFHRPETPLVVTKTTITTSLNQAQFGSLMMDYYVGLQWVHQGISHVTVRLGYEMQYWSNQLRLISVQQLPAQGDLSLQGATCGISIDL